jgi:uncharacterized membrane protein
MLSFYLVGLEGIEPSTRWLSWREQNTPRKATCSTAELQTHLLIFQASP